MQNFCKSFLQTLQNFYNIFAKTCNLYKSIFVFAIFANFTSFIAIHCKNRFCKSLRSLQNKRNQLRWFLERSWPCTRPEREWVVRGLYMIKVCHRSCFSSKCQGRVVAYLLSEDKRGIIIKQLKRKIQKGDNYNTVVAT